jgi:hypothetical protein
MLDATTDANMPHTIENALDDAAISLVERNDQMGFYSFRVGELSTVICVDVGRLPHSDEAK